MIYFTIIGENQKPVTCVFQSHGHLYSFMYRGEIPDLIGCAVRENRFEVV